MRCSCCNSKPTISNACAIKLLISTLAVISRYTPAGETIIVEPELAKAHWHSHPDGIAVSPGLIILMFISDNKGKSLLNY